MTGDSFGASVDWSNLPVDIVNVIRDRLEVIDYVRSGAVCSSWHNYSTKILRRPQIPWLMFSREENETESLYFYSLSEQKKREISLPDLVCRSGENYVGSSEGYLIYLDDNDDNLHAANPITGAHFAFPPTVKLPNVTHINKTPGWTVVGFEFTDGEYKENGIRDYYQKAILSPSGDTAVVLHARREWLSFALIGDDSWTNVRTPLPIFEYTDMVFHKGRLHAVNFYGNLAVFDLDRPLDRPFLSMHCPIDKGTRSYDTRLVESPDGEDLFLVHRRECRIRFQSKTLTKDFKVFVLDKTTCEWNLIESLGDITMFIGSKCSMTLRTSEFPGLRRNCIYFCNGDEESRDLAIFSLRGGSLKRIYSDRDLGGWSQPIWFVPTLA